MSRLLENAIRRRDELRAQVDSLTQELEKMEEFVLIAQRLEEDSIPENLQLPLDVSGQAGDKSPSPGDGVQKSATVGERADTSAPRRPRTRNNPEPAVVMKAVIEILQTAEAPRTRSQILEELRQRGIHVGGHDPAKVLGTNIWRYMNRTQEIISQDDGYWLADRPRP